MRVSGFMWRCVLPLVRVGAAVSADVYMFMYVYIYIYVYVVWYCSTGTATTQGI